ncbi:small lysine-rich protein 1 [Trichomycterus rosablanca]|uniref:small lysine-rich protein 1 n=1 Tax=Trichomycterus rosablanca TaxID=2290929 RepID=UPI002F3535CE
MPTGTKKLRSHSAKTRKNNEKKRPSKKRSAKCVKPEVDILSPAAMENAYYISHNAVDFLEFRGFSWPEATKKKGKKKKKNKK